MSQNQTNSPAFPSATAPSIYGAWGITMRDYFAAAALPAAVAHFKEAIGDKEFSLGENPGSTHFIAAACYKIADAFLLVRDQQTARSTSSDQALEDEVLNYIRNLGLTNGSGISQSKKFRNRRADTKRALDRLILSGRVSATKESGPNHAITYYRAAK